MGTSGGTDAGGGRGRRAEAAGYVVRGMRPSDAADVGRVHVEVWRQAYAALMRANVLAALDPEAAVERWRKALAQPPDEVRRLVGIAPSGDVVAVAMSGPSRDRDAPTPWELWAVNVLDAHHGSGLADLLMEQLVGDEPATLWVVQGNERAVAFYRRHGFRADGTVKWDERTGTNEDRMVRTPPPASSPRKQQ
jgi:ribosomal protein S18 acetylase RimI-like enzyme